MKRDFAVFATLFGQCIVLDKGVAISATTLWFVPEGRCSYYQI